MNIGEAETNIYLIYNIYVNAYLISKHEYHS